MTESDDELQAAVNDYQEKHPFTMAGFSKAETDLILSAYRHAFIHGAQWGAESRERELRDHFYLMLTTPLSAFGGASALEAAAKLGPDMVIGILMRTGDIRNPARDARVARLHSALAVAQAMLLDAKNTPPNSDPRWVQIAEALAESESANV